MRRVGSGYRGRDRCRMHGRFGTFPDDHLWAAVDGHLAVLAAGC
ncbi:hypothetical protein [Actinoplanes teichomyceticus]|uniref:Uncharacterized protein n=1 Tax=Actinoplanes teichomyceticus TaxID=1867 RepID=A0A561WB53_ACTTI|nr:hypothetical protein [Actinoplanes teichomyceticus]TWG21094.1 hypothetical protein FHX34_103624 [Actinoplanes teichomyceticus]